MLRAEHCIFRSGNTILFEKEGSFDDLRAFVNLLTERAAGICAVCAPEPGEKEAYRFVMGSRSADLRAVAGSLREMLGAACGGRPEMIQGSVVTSQSKLREAFEKIISEKW